jgi:23S rRNA (guanosine2251-2'-O)-methyltransferase
MRELKELKIWLVGTSHDEKKSIFELDMSGSVALVMGSEGSGLRRLTRRECDFIVGIPMPGKFDNLNVSVAAGICLFETVRQRLNK